MLSIMPINHSYYNKTVSFKAKLPEPNVESGMPKKYLYDELYKSMQDLEVHYIEEQEIIPPPKTTANCTKSTLNDLETFPLKDGYTELHSLCLDKNIEGAKNFIKEHPKYDVNQCTSLGSSYMFIATFCIENEELANIFAGNKSLDLNKFSASGLNDLHMLCAVGYKDAVQKVIDNHPEFDIHQLTTTGKSYIDLARQNGHTDIVNIFEKLCAKSRINPKGLG